jgi:hypothetical protein
MPARFGAASAAEFYEPEIMPRGARIDLREPFALNGELVVAGGRGGRIIRLALHLEDRSRDGVWRAIGQWTDLEGTLGTLALTAPGSRNNNGSEGGRLASLAAANKPQSSGTYENCLLVNVYPGVLRPFVFSTSLGGAGYQGNPVVTFRQLVVAAAPAVSPGGFGS